MKVAFYAPMKPPTHPTPSGDRTMARSLMQALELGGADVTLASVLRVYDGSGEAQAQTQAFANAADEKDRLIRAGATDGWDLWFTYHNYYKAPDLLGPEVSRTLGIPYVLAEATRARKRLNGPWAPFAKAAEQASDAANVVFYLTEHDAEALRDRAPAHQSMERLRPFLPIKQLPTASDRSGGMLSVGMFRPGDKLASYRLIAETLSRLPAPDWQLDIVGDGIARAEVTDLMRPFGARVALLGEMTAAELKEKYKSACLLLWPGVNEAFGLTYLEAQAAGIPVVAQDRPGVRDVLAPDGFPAVADGPKALAARVNYLLSDREGLNRAGNAARAYVGAYHLMGSAAETLSTTLRSVLT